MSSNRQVFANRRNGLKGGVKTAAGKAISRMNARKHSIFVTALTAEDSEAAHGFEEELIASLRPVGRVEEMLVEKLALTWLRMQRCARAEAEYHTQTWEEPNPLLNPHAFDNLMEQRDNGARGVVFAEEVFERMVKLIDLYDSRLTSQFLKLLHEVERLQLLREARKDAPPDVAVSNVERPPSAAACPEPVEATPQAPDVATTNGPAKAPERRASAPETAPAPAIAKSQDAVGQEDAAQNGDLKKRTQFAATETTSRAGSAFLPRS